MLKAKKIVCVIFVLSLFTAGTSPCVSAGYLDNAAGGHVCDHGYHTFGDKKLTRGVGTYAPYPSVEFWIDPALSNVSSTGTQFNYADLVSLAVMDWRDNTVSRVGVDTPINLHYTNTRLYSIFEFLKDTSLPNDILGLTTHWKSTSTFVNLKTDGSLNDNFGWTKISLNTSLLNSGFSNNTTQRKVTIAHELGHAFGLSHRNNVPSSIMCQYRGGTRTATYPSASDCNAINHLYPKPSYK